MMVTVAKLSRFFFLSTGELLELSVFLEHRRIQDLETNSREQRKGKEKAENVNRSTDPSQVCGS